jgi:hypothetical protein
MVRALGPKETILPINPGSIKEPAHKPIQGFAPPGGMLRKVLNDDTWGKLAQTRGMTAWELIRYNYPGLSTDRRTAIREVNWYLQERVGCKLLASDQNSYRFSSADIPGLIWMPIPGLPPGPDALARKTVLSVLRGPKIAKMNFGVGRFVIFSSQYEEVAQAIERGFIKVHGDPTRSNNALYHYDTNVIDIAPGMTDYGLIVHECTHAIFDIQKYTAAVEEAEGIAYVAQQLYGLLNSPTGRRGPWNAESDYANLLSWLGWQTVIDEAGALADKVATDFYVTAAEAATLYMGLRLTNFYRDKVDNIESFDGLDAAFY